jgi:membrane protein DedA with SNARE-associated domain
LHFLILNATGAILWSILISSLGYIFGRLLETFMGNIRRYELAILVFIAIAGISVWIIHLVIQKKKREIT